MITSYTRVFYAHKLQGTFSLMSCCANIFPSQWVQKIDIHKCKQDISVYCRISFVSCFHRHRCRLLLLDMMFPINRCVSSLSAAENVFVMDLHGTECHMRHICSIWVVPSQLGVELWTLLDFGLLLSWYCHYCPVVLTQLNSTLSFTKHCTHNTDDPRCFQTDTQGTQ